MSLINSIQAASSRSFIAPADIDAEDSAGPSLEERAVRAYAESYMTAQDTRNDISRRLNSPTSMSPDDLLALEIKSSNYSLHLSLIGTLARKVSTAAETLLRA